MSNRRDFLTNATRSLALAPLVALQTTEASAANVPVNDLEEWLAKIKGEQKMVFDAPSIREAFLTIWAWTYFDTYNDLGTPDQNLSVVIMLRHRAIGLAMNDETWKKYALGKFYDISDPETRTPATRNPYWEPAPGQMPDDGMALKKLQARGALFGVCARAISNASKSIARSKNLDAAAVRKDLIDGLHPGIQVVPSGVWALQKVQQLGCAYCFAG